MRAVLRLVGFWYLALTVLALSGVSILPREALLSGIGWMWLCYAIFWVAASYRYTAAAPRVEAVPPVYGFVGLLALSLLTLYASNVMIDTYTGLSLREVIDSLLRSESLYNRYQEYFERQGLTEFSLEKVPGIVAASFLKLSLLYVAIRVLVLQDARHIGHWVSLAVVVVAYLSFSVSRGTSFELFEILLLVWFATAVKPLVQGRRLKKSSLSTLVVVTLAAVALGTYSFNIAARYSFGARDTCVTAELCRDAGSFVYGLSPQLADLLFDLQTYFSFGLFYSSTFIEKVFFESVNTASMHLFPLGYRMMTGDGEGGVCDAFIDCGVAWRPAGVMHFQYWGLIGFGAILWFMGVVVRRIVADFEAGRGKAVESAALFLLVFYMISLPVGNFVFVSSSNVVAGAVVGVLLFMRWLGFRQAAQAKAVEIGAVLPEPRALNPAMMSAPLPEEVLPASSGASAVPPGAAEVQVADERPGYMERSATPEARQVTARAKPRLRRLHRLKRKRVQRSSSSSRGWS